MALTKQASDLIVCWTKPIEGTCHDGMEGREEGFTKRLGLRLSRADGWYVSVIGSDGEYYCLGYTPFMRRADAELAKRALEFAGLYNVQALIAAGPTKIITTMYEGLAW